MSNRRTMLGLGLGLLVVVATTAGCAPEPSEQAVLSYLSNARVHGEVRRAWPAGQEYVDKVLKTDAELQKELTPLGALASAESLWPKDDPRWRDQEEVEAHVKELTELAEGREFKRAKLLQELSEALGEVPDGLDLETPEQAQAFAEKARQSLALQGIDLRQAVASLEDHVAARLRLYREVQAVGDGFAEDQVGLSLKDATRQAEIIQAYDALQGRFQAGRERFLEYAEQRLAAVDARLETVDKRKQWDEYKSLGYERKYLRDQLEAVPKNLYVLIQAAQKELKSLEKEPAKAEPQEKARREAKIAFLKSRIEWLTAEREQIKARLDPIIRKP